MADGSAYKCTPRISLSTRAFSSRNDPGPFGAICGAAQAVSALLPHRNHDRCTSQNEWIPSTMTSIPIVQTGQHEGMHFLSPGPVLADYRVCNQADFCCRGGDSKDVECAGHHVYDSRDR